MLGGRSAARNGSNILHGGYNGPGVRSLHLAHNLQANLKAARALLPPRSPPHKLFSASENLFQRLLTQLTAPGLKLPFSHNLASRSLHGTFPRIQTIQNSLSLPARISLSKFSLRRQANTFLPRAPKVPPRCGGVAQVGLGLARNFSTARPVFEQIAQNIPIAVRALYEADMDLDRRKVYRRHSVCKTSKSVRKTSRRCLSKLAVSPATMNEELASCAHGYASSQSELDNYFAPMPICVATYLSIPLAPSTSSRVPLPRDPPFNDDRGQSLLPPLPFISAFHDDHLTHTLRVDALFARLDQADVWSQSGVRCYAYSEGLMHHRQSSHGVGTEGVCTVLKIEFQGWSESKVRSVIGESGTGWCTLEEVCLANGLPHSSSTDSLDSLLLDDNSLSQTTPHRDSESFLIDPAESLIIPSIEISSSESFSLSRSISLSSFPIPDMEADPWLDAIGIRANEHSRSILSSPLSSCSDISESIIDPPSLSWPANGATTTLSQHNSQSDRNLLNNSLFHCSSP